MTPLESLTKKLHALLPELTELKFGQRIRHQNFTDCHHECNVPNGIIVRIEQESKDWNFYYTESGARVHDEEISCCGEILGHPITLEDVLKALGLCNPDIMISESNGRNGGFVGSFNESGDLISHELHDLLYMWNFGLTLNQQNPKLHEFLDNLIPDPPSHD